MKRNTNILDKYQDNEILLFEKGKKGLVRMLFGRTGIVFVMLAIQALYLFSLFAYLENLIPYIFGGVMVFTLGMVIHILNTDFDNASKITWIILVTLLPAFGAMLYIFIRADVGHRALKARFNQIIKESQKSFPTQQELRDEIKREDKGLYNLTTYLKRCGGFVPYTNSSVKFFPVGEDKFQEMIIQLESAKEFIFMEYFIVDEGYMWGKILNILAKKTKEGVEVRIMYDGTCEFSLLPHNYPKKLKELGIKCKIFAPISPFMSTHYNYRDHRKILVIDGHTAFTGGINLADEYINKKDRFGHWKDTAVMIKGEAVSSFTIMFIQMWSIEERHLIFDPFIKKPEEIRVETGGVVIPYGDCPLDNDKVGEMVYMDILNRADNYVHIMSPYLILDGELITALKYAAQRGVEVKIILPHIPDKKIPFSLAISHYKELISEGIEIYEYTPGFVHAKVFVSDDEKAVVGTINLDYRSLYHHFECAAYMEGMDEISVIESDFNNTLEKCERITLEKYRKIKLSYKVIGKVFKVVSPLM